MPDKPCLECGGTGRLLILIEAKVSYKKEIRCPYCEGSGRRKHGA